MFASMNFTRPQVFPHRLAGATLSLFGLALQLQAAETAITVRYRSAQTVYLDAGSLSGLEVGDRLEVIHGVDVVAKIQVIFAAEHSVSCSILEEKNQISAGDLVRQVGYSSSTPIENVPNPVFPPADDAAEATEDEPTIEEVIQAQAAELALAPSAVAPGRWQPPRGTRKRTTQVSGTIIAELESFTDESEDQKLDFQRLGARVSLRILDIGGHP